MRRREIVSGLAGVLATAVIVHAQEGRATGKIGYVHPKTIDPTAPSLTILRPVWERLGYSEPETVLLRSADNQPERLPFVINELIGLGVGVLIAVGPAAVKAASAQGRIPVVAIDLETNPVRSGLAASFGHPGG